MFHFCVSSFAGDTPLATLEQIRAAVHVKGGSYEEDRVRAEAIGTIVNTHANGDHCHGNGCCPHAEIIASDASAKEMAEVPPAMLAQVKKMGGQLGPAGINTNDFSVSTSNPAFRNARSIFLRGSMRCGPSP